MVQYQYNYNFKKHKNLAKNIRNCHCNRCYNQNCIPQNINWLKNIYKHVFSCIFYSIKKDSNITDACGNCGTMNPHYWNHNPIKRNIQYRSYYTRKKKSFAIFMNSIRCRQKSSHCKEEITNQKVRCVFPCIIIFWLNIYL